MKQELQIQKKYMKTQKISEGSYGVVYKGKKIETGQMVAIKKFKNITNQGIPVSCVRELHVLNLLKSSEPKEVPQLTLKLYDVYQEKNQIEMVVQWMDETLSDMIQRPEPLDGKKFFKDIVKSVLQLHEHYIIHRDIKPSNIMSSHATGVLKVIDYGMAKEVEFQDRPLTNEVGSLYYRAPQLLLGTRHYDFSIDVWSLGCVFYEILTKKVLFKGENQIDQLNKILAVTGTPKPDNEHMCELIKKFKMQPIQENWSKTSGQIPEQSFSLLKSMLSIDPKTRPSVSEILSHKYLQSTQ